MRTPATCHPERPVRSHGFCNACYIKMRRSGWRSGRTTGERVTERLGRPSRRASCHPSQKHYCRGLCVTCYRRARESGVYGQPKSPATCHPFRRAYARDGLCKACWMRKAGRPGGNNLRRYGLTADDYDALLAAQGGGCAICERRPEGRRRFHVDHDHVTGRVRGILCNGCNFRVAAMESPLRARVEAYLDEHG